jgi:cell division protein FtsB
VARGGGRRTLSGMSREIRHQKSTGDHDGEPVARARRRSALTIVLLAFALSLVIDGIAGEQGWIANRRNSRQLELAAQDLAQKRRENALLQDLATRLKDQDPATIEEIARREYGYIRPGEKVFIVRDVAKPVK